MAIVEERGKDRMLNDAYSSALPTVNRLIADLQSACLKNPEGGLGVLNGLHADSTPITVPNTPYLHNHIFEAILTPPTRSIGAVPPPPTM